MSKKPIEIENDAFSCKQTGDVALVTLKQDASEIIVNIEIADALLSTFSEINESLKIKGIVITTSSKFQGDKNIKRWIAYVSQVLKRERRDIAIRRLKNIMLQLVNSIIYSSKPVVAALKGDIGQGVFGISLACDFRYGTPNATFHFPSIKYGLPTIGALAFFLVHNIGRPQSTDILLTKTSLSASEVNDLGLLTDITTDEELINRCIEKVNDINQYPSYGISAMKRVLRPDTNEMVKLMDKAVETFILNLNMIEGSIE